MALLMCLNNLTIAALTIFAGFVLLAGILWDYTGFSPSAVMTMTAVPPVALMVKGGCQVADHSIVIIVVAWTIIGMHLGLWLTTSSPVDQSKLIVLVVILTLVAMQLAISRIPFLAERRDRFGSGLMAWAETCLTHVCGMVISIYLFFIDADIAKFRTAVVMSLLFSTITSLTTFASFSIMPNSSVALGLVLAVPTTFGMIGWQNLFAQPSTHPHLLSLLPYSAVRPCSRGIDPYAICMKGNDDVA